MFIGALTAQSLIVAIPDKVMLFVSFLATLFLIYIAIGFWRKTITNIEKTKADGEIVYLCQKILDTLANQWRGLNE